MSNGIIFKDFKKMFYNPKVKKLDLIKRIKNSVGDLDGLIKFLSKFRSELKSGNSLLNQALYGTNPLPKTIEKLNKGVGSFFSGNHIIELNWLAQSLVEYSSEINSFITLKREFEDKLIRGKYHDARNILYRIDTELCVSFWGIENRFVLEEYQYGTEQNWNARKLFLKEGTDPFVQFLASIFSLKSEKNVSFFDFNNVIDKWLDIDGISQDALLNLNEYIRFKGSFFSFPNYSRFAYIIYRESSSSVLDKYLLFKRICSHLILDSKYNSEIIKLLKYVSTKVNDSTLRNLLIIDQPLQINKLTLVDKDFLRIVDLYTEGKYQDFIKELNVFYNNHNTGELQIIELYVKSLCELNLEYKNLCSVPSILDDIGLAMHKVLMKIDETEDALVELVNFAYLFSNSRNGIFLYNFFNHQLGFKNQENYTFMFSSNCTFLNPVIFDYVSDMNCNHYFESNTKDELTIQLIKNRYDINSINSVKKEKIPQLKRKLYKARHFLIAGKIKEAKDIYFALSKKTHISIIAQYEIYSNLYDCNLKEKEYRDAIILFLDVYKKNPGLTVQMNYSKLLDGVIVGKFKNVGEKSTLIQLPIFFRINSEDRIRIKQALELFLKSVNCNKPTEFIDHVDNYEKFNILYFFKNVCSVDILQLSKAFNSTFQVNEERIGICKFLVEFDNENSKIYNEEIADLTQRNAISKVIGKINERKIFVNEEKLKSSLRNVQKQNVLQNEPIPPLNKESFDRYIKLHEYIKRNNEYKYISPVSFSDEGEIEISNKIDLDSFDVIIYYPAFQIFSTYFKYIRNLFVFNKENGLDTYLSTKIRHGTLPNHLRSVFETNHLVTTQSKNQYVENLYWKEKLKLNNEQNRKIQEYLARFSMNIDNYSKQIKDQYIQCQSELNKSRLEGKFDYSFTEEALIELYINRFHNVYEIGEFTEVVFYELWNKTENILEGIRSAFNNEYRDNFLRFLDELENNLTNNLHKKEINELLSQVMKCRTEIQQKLNNISQWFRRSESSYEGNYKVDVLAQTSIEITKNIHPNYSFDIIAELNSKATVRGEYHEHFIDVMNNCLFNMIQHSQLPSNKLNARLIIKEEKGNLNLIFSNDVDDPNDHIPKLLEVKENWGSHDSNIAQERGTGFPKVKKIISSDLNRKNSNFNFNINEKNIEIELKFELKEL